MRIELFITINITLISISTARVISQSAITSILRDIMSPTNTGKAMQLLNMAATRANKNIAIPTAFARNDCGLPARMNEHPAPVFNRNEPVRMANDMGFPRVIVTNGGTRILANERMLSPEFMYQQSVPRQVMREPPAYAANMIDLKQIYQAAPVALPRENAGYPCREFRPDPYLPFATLSNQYLPISTSTNSYLSQATSAPNSYLPAPAPNPYLPVSTPNPFLPSAFPLSGMSPSFLPPTTQSKGQFLRKIPIPPPML